LANKKKVYWDSCIWLALVKQEPGRLTNCEHVLSLARRGEVEIWTSSLTLAEVFKKQCDGPATPSTGLPEDQDGAFEAFISQDFVVEVQVDHQIGVTARRLLRKHSPLKKPQDGVHLASAVYHDLDEFHTFDAVNLLCLDGLVVTRNGHPLKICEPPAPPPPPVDLFTFTEQVTESAAADAPTASGSVLSTEDALTASTDQIAAPEMVNLVAMTSSSADALNTADIAAPKSESLADQVGADVADRQLMTPDSVKAMSTPQTTPANEVGG
jgi:predicted nucleic acid-binding protein